MDKKLEKKLNYLVEGMKRIIKLIEEDEKLQEPALDELEAKVEKLEQTTKKLKHLLHFSQGDSNKLSRQLAERDGQLQTAKMEHENAVAFNEELLKQREEWNKKRELMEKEIEGHKNLVAEMRARFDSSPGVPNG